MSGSENEFIQGFDAIDPNADVSGLSPEDADQEMRIASFYLLAYGGLRSVSKAFVDRNEARVRRIAAHLCPDPEQIEAFIEHHELAAGEALVAGEPI